MALNTQHKKQPPNLFDFLDSLTLFGYFMELEEVREVLDYRQELFFCLQHQYKIIVVEVQIF